MFFLYAGGTSPPAKTNINIIYEKSPGEQFFVAYMYLVFSSSNGNHSARAPIRGEGGKPQLFGFPSHWIRNAGTSRKLTRVTDSSPEKQRRWPHPQGRVPPFGKRYGGLAAGSDIGGHRLIQSDFESLFQDSVIPTTPRQTRAVTSKLITRQPLLFRHRHLLSRLHLTVTAAAT